MSSTGERDETEQRLLAEIRADPFADEPRMAYRDLLLERGDPRGELMAVDTANYGERVAALWAAHQARWMPAWAKDPDLDRGLLYAVELEGTLGEFVAKLPDILALSPVPVVKLRPNDARQRLPAAFEDVINVHTRPDGRVAAALWCSYGALEQHVQILELPTLRVIAKARHPTPPPFDESFYLVTSGTSNRVRFARDRDALQYDLVRGHWAVVGPVADRDRRACELAYSL